MLHACLGIPLVFTLLGLLLNVQPSSAQTTERERLREDVLKLVYGYSATSGGDVPGRLQRLSPPEYERLRQHIRKGFDRYVVSPDEYASAAFSVSTHDGGYKGSSTGSGSGRHSDRSDCSKAAAELNVWLILLTESEKKEYTLNHGRNLDDRKRKDYLDIVSRYDRHCLEGPDTTAVNVPKTRVAVQYPGNDDTEDPWCTAFNVGKGLLFTARHCLMGPLGRNSLYRFMDDPKRIESARTPWDMYAEKYSFEDWPIRAARDYAFPIQSRVKNDFVRRGPINQSRELLVVSFNQYVHIWKTMKHSDKRQPWTEAIRWSRPATSCYAALVSKEGCVFHGCQTSPASSGAALLQRDGSQLTMVGVHLGQSGTGGMCAPPTAELRDIGNIGFKLPAALTDNESWLLKLLVK